MSEPILKDQTPSVDRAKIGISYSGGGALVLVELGIARAFVQLGIVPAVITGASAGSLAGAAHALDVHTGKGIDMAADILGRITNHTLGLTALQVVPRVIAEREHTRSIGDNAAIGPLIAEGLQQQFGLHNVTMGTFAPPDYPRLMIVATDVVHQVAYWFPDDAPLEDAVIASSAIPGVFPWRKHATTDGGELVLVDGGVVSNQPLSNLAANQCGTIYACGVGPTGDLAEPNNGLDNALRSASLMMHQCTKLEEDYVRLKIGNQGEVHHIHPIVDFPVQQFNFTPALVQQIMADACQKTIDWLSQPHPD